jgi:hypothetical protein
MTRILHVHALVLLLGNAAAAQSIYVAGGVGADIVLASGQESIGLAGPTAAGESLSGAARLGTMLNDRFGVELEVSRAAEHRDSSSPGINPLAALFPLFVPQVDSRTQLTTVSATASIRQQVSDNVALAYLGGIVFHRTDSRVEYRGLRALPASGGLGASGSFIPVGAEIISPVGLVLPFSRIETVRYGAGPVVGFEAHIGVGEHFTVIPGVRMHGLPASWLVRPAVAAGWRF